mmetsp:Transcript_21216/g.46403  ORF Transcript_21216/g.46403 Transcript_21216/m.46403 type:complete len:430 (+) Transcript_21216:93-1382(+)
MAQPSGRPPSCTVFVGNIPYDVTDQMLLEIFQEVGSVKSLRLVSDKDTGKPKGYGFCEYYDQATAESAVRNLNGHEISGRSLRVDFAEDHTTERKDFRERDRDRDFRERDRDRRDRDQGRGPTAPGIAPGMRPVGSTASTSASAVMAAILGAPALIGAAQDKINAVIASMPPMQLFEIMAKMKALVQQNPTAARQVLVQSPQLTRALFQVQITLGMVKPPPAGQPAAQPPGPAAAGPGPAAGAPVAGGPAAPPPQPGPVPPHALPSHQPAVVIPAGPPGAPAPHFQPPVVVPTQYPAPAPAVFGAGVVPPGAAAAVPGLLAGQQPQMVVMGPGGVPQPIIIAPSAQAPAMVVNPGAPAPVAQPPAVRPAGMQIAPAPAAPAQAALPVQQQELLNQLLRMTPKELDSLPPDQRAHAMTIIQMMRGAAAAK